MIHCFYNKTIAEFIAQDYNLIYSDLASSNGNDVQTQKNTWEVEIQLLKQVLLPWKDEPGRVLFEYTIPRIRKRLDAVVLLRDIVLVLEFKAGDQTTYLKSDEDQVMDYALNLKSFHEESERAPIVPILVVPEAPNVRKKFVPYKDLVYIPLCANAAELQNIIAEILQEVHATYPLNLDLWEISNYQPTPTIVEAATMLFAGNNVEEITRTDASGASIKRTTKYIEQVVARTKEAGEKAICFLTGVPGAGKTLVGLNIAFRLAEQYKSEDNNPEESAAVYLSGNGPLVKVLVAALARDKQNRDHCKISEARTTASAKVQSIYAFREQMLQKLQNPIEDDRLQIDPAKAVKSEKNGYAEHEHIAIFDEAQRCWDHAKLADWLKRGGSYGNKLKIANFPMSEAEFLIWSMNLRPDWGVIVCLVGGGQEIHTGEAGIGEWVRAINATFPAWKVYISDQLTDSEYEKGNTQDEINQLQHVESNSLLHLKVNMRSYRAENLSHFVKALLDMDVVKSKSEYAKLQKINPKTGLPNYPLVITRDVEKAKKWLKDQARGTERYGIMVSSKAERLRPLAIDVKRAIDVEKWFLDDQRDLKSSYYMEDIATEFDVQGLELDWACVVWDGDFRYQSGQWGHYQLSSNKWHSIKNEENQNYQLNAYRVLLTRARQGVVICVPEGNSRRDAQGNLEDPTRDPKFYDSTYEYLKSIIGIEEINDIE